MVTWSPPEASKVLVSFSLIDVEKREKREELVHRDANSDHLAVQTPVILEFLAVWGSSTQKARLRVLPVTQNPHVLDVEFPGERTVGTDDGFPTTDVHNLFGTAPKNRRIFCGGHPLGTSQHDSR